jgi:hypothetical protein
MRGGSTAQENAVLKEEQLRRLLGNMEISSEFWCDAFLSQKEADVRFFFCAGMKYVLDMQNDDDRKRLAKMIRQHKQGAGGASSILLAFRVFCERETVCRKTDNISTHAHTGDFNMVKLDGKDYELQGTQGETSKSQNSHFDGMKGQTAAKCVQKHSREIFFFFVFVLEVTRRVWRPCTVMHAYNGENTACCACMGK